MCSSRDTDPSWIFIAFSFFFTQHDSDLDLHTDASNLVSNFHVKIKEQCRKFLFLCQIFECVRKTVTVFLTQTQPQ